MRLIHMSHLLCAGIRAGGVALPVPDQSHGGMAADGCYAAL